MNKVYAIALILITSFTLSGCGEIRVYDADVKLSHTIQIVEPVANSKKAIFLRIKDITGSASELASAIEIDLQKDGYSIVTDPSAATFKLMINIIKFGTGTPEDQITFMQAVDPKTASEVTKERYSVKTIRRYTELFPGQRMLHPHIVGDKEVIETTSITPFADRTAIADVEVIDAKDHHLKTRLMVGVNMRGGFLISPTPHVDQAGWTRLIQRLSRAIASIF